MLQYISLSADEIVDFKACCEEREKTVAKNESLNESYFNWYRDFISLNFNYSAFKLFMATQTHSERPRNIQKNVSLRFSHEIIFDNRRQQISNDFQLLITDALNHPERKREPNLFFFENISKCSDDVLHKLLDYTRIIIFRYQYFGTNDAQK